MAQIQPGGGFAAQSHFGTVDAENTRVAARRAMARCYALAWEEAELHQAAGNILGKVEAIEDTIFAVLKL
jgi:hypothetical protein